MMAPIIAELFHFSLPTPSGGQIFLLAQKDLDEKGRLGGGLCTSRHPPKYPLLRNLRHYLSNAWARCFATVAPAGVVLSNPPDASTTTHNFRHGVSHEAAVSVLRIRSMDKALRDWYNKPVNPIPRESEDVYGSEI
jgi:hypothetical protein